MISEITVEFLDEQNHKCVDRLSNEAIECDNLDVFKNMIDKIQLCTKV